MRAVRVYGPGDVRVDDLPDPVPGPQDVVVRVRAVGLCGTDLAYVARGGVAGPSNDPLAIGHEISGVVESVGSAVPDVATGDHVVVHPGDDNLGRIGNGAREGGLAELLLVRNAAGRLLAVPDSLDLTTAALTEPVAVGMHAAEQLALAPGDTAVVLGGGPIGLAALASLLDRGVGSVAVIEPGKVRRDIALELGASGAFDPSDDCWRRIAELHGSHPRWPGSTMTSGYVDASGSADMLKQVIRRAAPRAHISVPALYTRPVEVDMLTVMMKELEIRGSMEYPDRFADALDLLLRRDLSPMVTHLVDLDEAARTLADPATMREAGKTVAVVAR